MDIPFLDAPELTNQIAYIAAGSALGAGLLLVLCGRVISRLTVGLVGAGIGLLSGGALSGSMNIDDTVARAALASIFGVLGFVAAPFFWALFAGGVCASVAGGILGWVFLNQPKELVEVTPPAGGYSPEAWLEWFKVFSQEVGGAMWDKWTGIVLLVLVPSALIPLILGFWKQRFITIVMTSLVGALAVVGGALLGIAHSDPKYWPDEWSGLVIPLYIVGGLWVCGIAVQYSFAMAAARKKKAKENARKQAAAPSGRR